MSEHILMLAKTYCARPVVLFLCLLRYKVFTYLFKEIHHVKYDKC